MVWNAYISYIANMWVWNWLPNWEMFAPGSLFPNFKPFSIWEIPYVLCFVTNCYLPLRILCQTWFRCVLHYGLPGPSQQSFLISPKFLPLVCAVLTGLSPQFWSDITPWLSGPFWCMGGTSNGFKAYWWHDCQWWSCGFRMAEQLEAFRV